MAIEETPAPNPTSSSSLLGIDTTMLTLFYQDLAQPGVKQVGLALGTVFELSNIFIQPLKFYSEKKKLLYAKHLEDFRRKLEDIPEGNVVEVAPELGLPIMENLGKTTSEKISELYLNLLANASSIDFVVHTHPRFVSIIEDLTSDEVRILESFRERSYTPFISIMRDKTEAPEGQSPTPFNTTTTTFSLKNKATLFEVTDILSLRKNAPLYLQNLVSFGLIRAEEELYLPGDEYDLLLKSSENIINAPQESDNYKIRIEKGWYQLTEFGHTFLLACTEQ